MFPSPDFVRGQLTMLSSRQFMALVAATGIPYQTLNNIRCGKTPNPRIETVRKLLPHLGKQSEAA